MEVLQARRRMLSNASFSRLLDGGGQSATSVCFRYSTNSVSSGIGRCCESVLGEGKRRLHSSPLLEAKSELDAHEDSAVASEFVDRDFANPRT